MRKFLLSTFVILPVLGISAYAAPVSMSLFSGGLSLLDSLLLIGIGIALLGVLFLCIAFLKPSSKKEESIESPFDIYMEETASTDNDTVADEVFEAEPANATELDQPEEENTDTEPEEIVSVPENEPEPPLETEEAIAEEPEMEPEITDEPEPAEEAEPEPDPEPVEEKIYPKLILTNTKTNDFMILPLYAETTVGRKTDNDLVLTDITVSGLHCKILNQDGRVLIQDENSTNGTFVNGERVFDKAELHKGDKLLLGKQEFTVSINE
ncbi:MAG: FHA domain-containing protein [Clostridia bacterium]|nr:FHA domain-containing protein [Clostridia bacterium]